MLDEPDPERQLRLNARNSRVGQGARRRACSSVIRGAAPIDPDIDDALGAGSRRDFYDNQRVIVETLAREERAAPGLDVDRATDILWTLNHPDLWQLLVGQRGWTPDEYEQWFADRRLRAAAGLSQCGRLRARRA